MAPLNIQQFIDSQLEKWPMAASNFEALRNVEVKEIPIEGQTIKVQFNPARIVSSGAKVDAASLKARKCFLCAANRPAEQIVLPWKDYEILINPFPIFPRHLTIPATAHTDQRIKGRIADMMELAEALDGYTVFYNGPRCGASAPDHMHFQAGNSDFLTIAPALEESNLSEIIAVDGASLSVVTDLPLKVFVIDATDKPAAEKLFDRLYEAMPVPEGEEEPMMNLLCFTTPGGVRLVVIPRTKHRPSFYGTEGDDNMLISPASVDMGGVFITPRPQDYDRIDADIIMKIYDELCLNEQEITQIASNVE